MLRGETSKPGTERNALTRIEQASKSPVAKSSCPKPSRQRAGKDSQFPVETNRLKKPQWRTPKMSTEQPGATKPAKTFDSAYSFSFAIAIGLILFIAGLV